MNLVKSEKLEKNQHELQFSIYEASFNEIQYSRLPQGQGAPPYD